MVPFGCLVAAVCSLALAHGNGWLGGIAGAAAAAAAADTPRAGERNDDDMQGRKQLTVASLTTAWTNRMANANKAATFQLGAEVFLAQPTRYLPNTGGVKPVVAVLAHAASVLPNLSSVVDALALHTPDVRTVSILAPEHGFRGVAPAGEGGKGGIDPSTGLPVRSIYRKTGKALVDEATRDGASVVVVDLQDVGCRFYTYVWTLYDLLVAFAEARHRTGDTSLRVVVLDRPNPLGGVAVQGPVTVEPRLSSLVGRKSIALRHGMTVGEVARYFVGEFVGDAAGVPPSALDGMLTVVPMNAYRRSASFNDLGLPFVPPSPNMPNALTALIYPGMGLFEGVANATEGRGTTLPFVQVGAPWAGRDVAERAATLAGTTSYARFRLSFFAPVADRCAGVSCAGVHVYPDTSSLPLGMLDPSFDPIRIALALLASFMTTADPASSFGWRFDGIGVATGGGIAWVDRLLGTSRIREALDRDPSSVASLPRLWSAERDAFLGVRARYLLY